MFKFIVKYLNFLKYIPLLPHMVDGMTKLNTYLFRPKVLDCIDEIEKEVLSWEGTHVSIHCYGGLQFNVRNKEIGHIHSNGLMDILFKRDIKMQLIKEGKVEDHHTFSKSGWISYYIHSEEDKKYALELLQYSYILK